MATLISRGLSILVLVTYVVAAHRLGALAVMLKLALPLLLAVACIWFPDAFGEFSGVIHFRAITSPTPGVLVGAVGWLILLALPPIVWYVASSTATA